MELNDHITAVILAGGKNSRFQGKIKSLEPLNSYPLIYHEIKVLKQIFRDIIIITNNIKVIQKHFHLPVYEDIYKRKGPLGGIHAGMVQANTKYIFIVGGDMPFLDKNLITTQINLIRKHKYDAIIPQTINGFEPLHGIYDTELHTKLEKLLSSSGTYPIRTLLHQVNTYFWQIAEQNAFININTPQELEYYNSFYKLNNKDYKKHQSKSK
jgi:molybdopterin-guanine dinucleotide biosynthesis protein A